MAMDETRLLILGSQVLFGFLFQGVFQNGFDSLSSVSKNLVCAALAFATKVPAIRRSQRELHRYTFASSS